MILPIRAYGDPVLRQKARTVEKDSPELQQLLDDMIETMRRADGAGLAAPQVGKNLRVFVADLTSAAESLPAGKRPVIPAQPMICINPELIYKSEEEREFEEGCLSIPGLVEKVRRPDKVTLAYLDRNFRKKQISGFGSIASVLQHENDHLDGVLHIDYLTPFRKRLIRKDLNRIAGGDFGADYPMQTGER